MKLSTAKALGLYHPTLDDFKKALVSIQLGGDVPECAFLPEDVWMACFTSLPCNVTNARSGYTILVFDAVPNVYCIIFQERFGTTEIHFEKRDT